MSTSIKDRTIRIGLIGTGFMAGAHASCYAQDSRVEIGCVCDQDLTRAEEFARKYGEKSISDDWQKVIPDPSIDLIDITVPNFLHYDIALEAAKKSKPFIIEKPLSISVDQAEEVVKTARKNGVRGFYAENRLFAPIFTRAREMITRGEIGNPKLFRINELGSGPGHAGWFRDKSKSGGGSLIDIGIHGICLSEWLMNSPIVSVTSMAAGTGGIEETVVTNCRFENGVLGQFVCSWGILGGLDIRAEVFGDQGTLLLDQSKAVNGIMAYKSEQASAGGDRNRPHLASDTGWSYPYVDEWNVKGHRYELLHFIDCITEDVECRSPVERGLRSLKVIHAIYRSVESGREVSLPRNDGYEA